MRSAYKLDGTYYPITGSPTLDDQAITRKDAFGITGSLRKAGKVVQTSSRTVSRDGKVMTITFQGTNAEGQAVHNVLVFDRR
jgi:hypothetical protein